MAVSVAGGVLSFGGGGEGGFAASWTGPVEGLKGLLEPRTAEGGWWVSR